MKEQLSQNIETPENIQNSKDNDQEKEGRKIKGEVKFVLDGKEYKLETHSYDFEYPERIQKETGILGYKRTIIDKQEISNFFKEFCKEKYNINIELEKFDDFDDLIREISDKRKKEFGGILDPKKYNFWGDWTFSEENEKRYKDFMKNTEEGKKESKFLSEYSKTKEFFLIELNRKLSKGEFPNRTLNHSIGKHQKGDHEKNFIDDKFFIQKLFDVNLTKKIKLGKRNTSVDSWDPIIMNVFDKSNGEAIGEVSTESLNEYENKINDDKVFLIGYDAFNTSVTHLWDYNHSNNINFGFSLNDNLFEEYVKKIYEIFLKNNTDTERELIGIEQIIRMIAFSNNDFYKEYKIFFKKSSSLSEKERGNEKNRLNKIFNDIREKFLLNINQDEAILNKKIIDGLRDLGYNNNDGNGNGNEQFLNKIKNIMDRMEDTISPYNITTEFLRQSTDTEGNGSGDKTDEVCIPIFINHDEVPQLSWGHAKYANFINKKGFNFFEFKHAEHLPKKDSKGNI